jgi:protein O-GlcNAc transferase
MEARCMLGVIHAQRGEWEAANRAADEALKSGKGAGGGYYNLGCLFQNLGRHRDAVACFDSVLRATPNAFEALIHRGLSNLALGEAGPALADCEKSLMLRPQEAGAWLNRGNALAQLLRHEEALASYGRALALRPGDMPTLTARGASLVALARFEQALACFDKILRIDPQNLNAFVNRGRILGRLGRYEEAALAYDKVLALDPKHPYLASMAAQYRLHCCDWNRFEEDRQRIASSVAADEEVVPHIHLRFSSVPEEHLRCAKTYAARKHPPLSPPLWRGEKYSHDRIRLAYVSADFRLHPVSRLFAGVLASHDKTRFEITAISLGPDDRSAMRQRIADSAGHFADARGKSDLEIAKLMREMEVDIAVDLMGFTTESRTSIFAARPAPLTVNYLGYPGTMGAPYIDYILADQIVIPEEARVYYAEKVAYLPHCYLPNDSSRPIAAKIPSRKQADLPDKGFVFVSFNNSYKFAPDVFAIWTRLLHAVKGSVLWLAQPGEAAMRKLRREAEARGIAAERIIFAPHVPDDADHLARLSLADLFLDTLPFNAHSTACDALWAGVPVLTCLGTAFAGRVAASAINAAGLNEMITQSPEDYERLALRLAREPELLAGFKAKLASNRATAPLFDTRKFTAHLEAAFEGMWDRHRRGLAPKNFAVNG